MGQKLVSCLFDWVAKWQRKALAWQYPGRDTVVDGDMWGVSPGLPIVGGPIVLSADPGGYLLIN
mgnify:CR=1 FL=1